MKLWVIFNFLIVVFLGIDLLLHRKEQVVRMKEALLWSGIWIALALLFNTYLYFFYGKEAGIAFLTGYVVEKSLSVDNLFVFLLIFRYFKTPPQFVHKVLFYGVVGAILMRALFIFLGITILSYFHWTFYLFGLFLLFMGFKLLFEKKKELEPEKNVLLTLFHKFIPTTHTYEGNHFFVRKDHTLYATPLFVTLLIVEWTDLLFALDSIPVIIGITQDPFIIYSSNIFAILGLRSLYFVLARFLQLFYYLHLGIAAILIFIGLKMLVSDFIEIPILITLGIIAVLLSLSILFSLLLPKKS